MQELDYKGFREIILRPRRESWRIENVLFRALTWGSHVLKNLRIEVAGRGGSETAVPVLERQEMLVRAPAVMLAHVLLQHEPRRLYGEPPYHVQESDARFPIFPDLPRHGEPRGVEWDCSMIKAYHGLGVCVRLEPQGCDVRLVSTEGIKPQVVIDGIAPAFGYEEVRGIALIRALWAEERKDYEEADQWFLLAHSIGKRELEPDQERAREEAIKATLEDVMAQGYYLRDPKRQPRADGTPIF